MINFHISKSHLLVCFKPQIQATRVVPDRTAVGLTKSNFLFPALATRQDKQQAKIGKIYLVHFCSRRTIKICQLSTPIMAKFLCPFTVND